MDNSLRPAGDGPGSAEPSGAPSPGAPVGWRARRTFAIISHPDAGKTTLTERLLLSSGAIRLAGDVKARGDRRRARSDWMEIEQKRGISVTSSVMTFEHDGLTFNLLDTPGHSDFSEDTYRTLTAVDSAVMVLDAAKGIESQTLKLFEVCRLRDIPIITFINKVDREGLDPLALLDEIAGTLALDVSPVLWPLGMGLDFRGCLDLRDAHVTGQGTGNERSLDELAADPACRASLEALDIARSALPAFDLESYRQGHMTPVFFGSALRNVGVRELLDAIGRWAPPPQPQPALPEAVSPREERVTGFVFKVQANMDPGHRDRVAFVRLVSGKFRRGMKLHNARLGKELAVMNPIFFFAQDRETVDEAYAGDVIGIPNHGLYSVGDSLTEGTPVKFTGIPNFAPEIIRRVRLADPMRSKQLARALNDLAEEGVTQVFRPLQGNDWLIGVLGQLQLDVLAARVEKEYGVPIGFEDTGHESARWVACEDAKKLKQFLDSHRSTIAEDRFGAPVFLARNAWTLNRAQQEWPDIQFLATRERH